jgi:uncharacterized protein YbaR (Trm112 family)
MKRESQEMVIQKFPHRCPYCDQPLSYEKDSLKPGENERVCPFCKKKFIKVVLEETPSYKKMKRGIPRGKGGKTR